jgi:hypothetical protein
MFVQSCVRIEPAAEVNQQLAIEDAYEASGRLDKTLQPPDIAAGLAIKHVTFAALGAWKWCDMLAGM